MAAGEPVTTLTIDALALLPPCGAATPAAAAARLRTALRSQVRAAEAVAGDAAVLHMDKEDLIEDFLIAYQEALTEIGFTTREIARMAAAALVG